MDRPTIRDVAREAQVSTATADRALNGRPGVRPETVRRVREAADAIMFRKDIHAANLAKGRGYRLIFLVPGGDNAFFAALRQACAEAALRHRSWRTALEIETVQPLDEAAIGAAIERHAGADAIAVVAPETPLLIEKAAASIARGTPIINLISSFASLPGSQFIGIDNAAAGRTAGELLVKLAARREGALGILIGSATLRDHAERRFGFEQVVRGFHPGREIVFLGEGFDDRDRSRGLVRGALEAGIRLAGLYSAGAGNRGVIAALAAVPAAERPVFVGHELTPHMREALIDGIADAVIAQDCTAEVEAAVQLMRGLADREPGLRAEPVPIQIFIRGNLPHNPGGSGRTR